MAISSTTSRVSYAGNGATTAFSFPYYFQVSGDLVVIVKNNTTGVETVKTITTHYTISGTTTNGVYESGGTVTMLVAPTASETLIIYRDPSITQGLDLGENDALPAESVEQALDKQTMIAQRLDSRMDRAVVLPEGFTATFDLQLPADLDDSADKVPLVNATGDGWADAADWPTADDINDAQTNATAAAASATAASGSATLASEWASKTNGQVATTDYSAKAYAIGGTGVTNTSGAGAAKEWATTTGATVDTSEYSSKEYAQGTTVATGSSKDWATKTSAAVAGGDYSSKEWAKGTQTRGAASGGSAKDWANYTGGTVDDTEYSAKKYATDAAASAASATVLSQSYEIANLGLATSVGSSALTIALKQSDGSTNPASGTGAVKIGFRSATLTSGAYNQRTVTGALSLVISSGSTLGQVSGQPSRIYVYAIDNAGTVELAVSSTFYPENQVISTTAEGGAGAADSRTVIYSTTARTNVPIRLIGTIDNTQATAGTWASAGTTVAVGNSSTTLSTSNPTIQVFSSGSGTFYTPAGAKFLRVKMVGGGGGGAGSGTAAGSAATSGGDSTFGSVLTAGGGVRGLWADTGRGTGGTNTINSPAIAIINAPGSDGGGSGAVVAINTAVPHGGDGGASALGGAGGGGNFAQNGTDGKTNTGGGGGGAGAGNTNANYTGAGGGGGGYNEAIIPNPDASYSYVVGAGGNAGAAGSSGTTGGAGGSGLIVVEVKY